MDAGAESGITARGTAFPAVSPLPAFALALGLLVALPVWEVWVSAALGYTREASSWVNSLIGLGVLSVEVPIAGYLATRYSGLRLRMARPWGLRCYRQLVRWLWVPIWIGGLGLIQEAYHGYRLSTAGFGPFIVFQWVAYGALSPLVEELVFRGLLFGSLWRRGRLPAYVLTTIAFTLSHVPSYERMFLHGEFGLTPYRVVCLVVFSLACTRLYEKTQSLLPCIVLHSVTNLLPWIGALIGAVLEIGPNS